MSDTLVIVLVGMGLTLLAVWPFWRARRRRETAAEAAREEAERYSLHVPASLHPVVDPSRCAGCGACVSVCPEGGVLGLVAGRAEALQPARCVGHGLCQRACPTDAIRLVFGTAERGVELPMVRETYETNVPGLYIVGELGGMGLVRNAVEQGRQAVEGIARAPACRPHGGHDLVIIGGGPAGLSAALTAQQHGLDTVIVEREADLGGAVRAYPRGKLVLTQPFELPGWGWIRAPELRKEALAAVWREAAEGLSVRAGETMQHVTPLPGGGFEVITDRTAERGALRAGRVVLAIGRRGTPRRLGVPGEAAEHVRYALDEPTAFAGERVLVVGGGDTAVEAALMLGDQPGTTVHLSYRKAALSRVKPANLARFEAAAESGRVTPLWETELTAIEPDGVRYTDAAGREHRLAADTVLVFIGGELPAALLRACGVEMATYFGQAR